MSELPEPFVLPAVDLRDFAYMPLDVVRLRDSDLAAMASDCEFRAAVMLWCAAWHQVPAGSLPDDDMILSHLAGFGRVVKSWKSARKGALRGWVKCSDGRLYHPVTAEKANEAWAAKQAQRDRTEKARLAKLEQKLERERIEREKVEREKQTLVTEKNSPVTELGMSVTENEKHFSNSVTGSKRREGKGREKEEEDAALSASARPRPDFKRLEFELRKAAGCENAISPGLADLSPIIGLMDQGADFEGEILPAITSKPKPDVRSWKWFIPQIQQFAANRRDAAKSGLPPPEIPKFNGHHGQRPARRNPHILAFEASERNEQSR